MFGSLLRRLFWSRCERHGVSYNSDMCPACVTERFVEAEERETQPGIETSLGVRRVLAKKKRAPRRRKMAEGQRIEL